ncbi:uncharacterized protein V6R79_020087 [Siganus canaliculatus]
MSERWRLAGGLAVSRLTRENSEDIDARSLTERRRGQGLHHNLWITSTSAPSPRSGLSVVPYAVWEPEAVVVLVLYKGSFESELYGNHYGEAAPRQTWTWTEIRYLCVRLGSALGCVWPLSPSSVSSLRSAGRSLGGGVPSQAKANIPSVEEEDLLTSEALCAQ